MLAHSPPLPLVIDYEYLLDDDDDDDDLLEEEDAEEGIILALEQRERVRYIKLSITGLNLQKLILAIDEEYPTLEYLILEPEDGDNTFPILPKTFQAPHLRHLALFGVTLPIESRLLVTAVGLVTLFLDEVHPFDVQPAVLLRWLSFLPQLENLIYLSLPAPNRDAERRLIQRPVTTHISLPNLRSLTVEGVSSYLEALFRRITTPRLEKLRIDFLEQRTYSVPRLPQFIGTTEIFRFDCAQFEFYDGRVFVRVYPVEAETAVLIISVMCWHLD